MVNILKTLGQMVLRFKLIHSKSIPFSYHLKTPKSVQWKKYYRPPFHILFQIAELFAVSIYMFSVLNPVQSDAQILRNVFKDIFFLEKHESPVSKASDLDDYYAYLQEQAETINDNFIMEAKFPDEETLVYHTITYTNGSTSINNHPDVEPESLKNISTILTSIPIYIYSTRKPITACTIWELVITVSDISSNPAFFLSSKLYWHHCPLDQNSMALDVKIDQKNTQYYRMTKYSMTPLFFASISHIIYLISYLFVKGSLHKKWRKTDPNYQELPSTTQFHYTIGIWPVFELLASSFLIASVTIVAIDARKMTEYPSLIVMQIFAVSATPMFLTLLQWFQFNSYSYQYVAILREGTIQLLTVAISFLPVICAFFFVGILVFANFAEKARSYFSMTTILVAFTLGDNIMPTYNDFSDGSTLFNWVAFAYITLMVLVAAWTVFASFTAMVTFIHQKLLLKEHLHNN